MISMLYFTLVHKSKTLTLTNFMAKLFADPCSLAIFKHWNNCKISKILFNFEDSSFGGVFFFTIKIKVIKQVFLQKQNGII